MGITEQGMRDEVLRHRAQRAEKARRRRRNIIKTIIVCIILGGLGAAAAIIHHDHTIKIKIYRPVTSKVVCALPSAKILGEPGAQFVMRLPQPVTPAHPFGFCSYIVNHPHLRVWVTSYVHTPLNPAGFAVSPSALIGTAPPGMPKGDIHHSVHAGLLRRWGLWCHNAHDCYGFLFVYRYLDKSAWLVRTWSPKADLYYSRQELNSFAVI